MNVTKAMDRRRAAPWLFFMFQLPAQRASRRVSVWRKLQKYGALAWRNSAYVLPHTPGNVEKFQWLSAEIRKYGGAASVIEASRVEGYSDRQIVALFNEARGRDYDALIRDIRLAMRPSASRRKGGRPGALARLNRRLTEIAAVDVFGCLKRKEAENLMKQLESLSRTRSAGNGENGTEKAGSYRRRLWMTRPRPEVDRVSSAWLIKRFLDPEARFAFSLNPLARPGAVRFDMFEGEFTHEGEDCTFETLLKRFAIRDRRLRLIGQIVHDADLEDNKFGRREGVAIDLILKGWGKMDWADEEIVKRGFDLFDALYLSLTHQRS
jgi:hypothetical protein